MLDCNIAEHPNHHLYLLLLVLNLIYGGIKKVLKIWLA